MRNTNRGIGSAKEEDIDTGFFSDFTEGVAIFSFFTKSEQESLKARQ